MFVTSVVIISSCMRRGAFVVSTPLKPNFAVVMANFCSLGIDAVIVLALTVVLYAGPDSYIGTTAAFSLSSRFIGGSVGTAIYFNIFNTHISTKVPPTYVATAAIEAGLPAANAMESVGALLGSGGGVPGASQHVLEAAGLATRWTFAASLVYVWYTTIAFSVTSIVCCAFLPNIQRFTTESLWYILPSPPGW